MRVTGEDTYVEETQAVGDGGELHAQKVTRKCAVDIAMRWTNGYDTTMRSFVNVVETPGGGMHVDGFLLGMTKQIRKAIEDNARKLKVNLKDSNMKVERDDILAGLVAVAPVVSANRGTKATKFLARAGQADRQQNDRQAVR